MFKDTVVLKSNNQASHRNIAKDEHDKDTGHHQQIKTDVFRFLQMHTQFLPLSLITKINHDKHVLHRNLVYKS